MDAVALWPVPRPAGAVYNITCAITTLTDNVGDTARIDIDTSRRLVLVKFKHVAGAVYDIQVSDCFDKIDREPVFPYPNSFHLLPQVLKGDNRSLIVASSISEESQKVLLIHFDVHLSKAPLRLPEAVVRDRSRDNGIARMGEDITRAPSLSTFDTRVRHHILILLVVFLLHRRRFKTLRSVATEGAEFVVSYACWVVACLYRLHAFYNYFLAE